MRSPVRNAANKNPDHPEITGSLGCANGVSSWKGSVLITFGATNLVLSVQAGLRPTNWRLTVAQGQVASTETLDLLRIPNMSTQARRLSE
jgi:hypothetical protein